MGADTPEEARRVAELLPAGTPVYVNHLPSRDSTHALPALVACARRAWSRCRTSPRAGVASREQVQALPRQGRAAGRRVTKVLLIGGDVAEPAGPYADSGGAAARRTCSPTAGLSQIGLRRLSRRAIRALPPRRCAPRWREKLALAREQGLAAYVVTQFCFAPNRIAEYCADLARRAPGVPVYVGLAGPASPVALLRYAQRCGVCASLRALQPRAWGPCGSSRTSIRASSSTALARQPQRQRQQRGGRAPLQLRRRCRTARVDERAHHRGVVHVPT